VSFYLLEIDFERGLMKKPAAFLDRDGVICEYVDHLHQISEFKLRDKAGEAIKFLNDNGFLVFVITNQPMIAKGLLNLQELSEIHNKMQLELSHFGAKIDAIEFCPHSIEGNVKPWNVECQCRKPKTGMIEKLCSSYLIDLNKSFLAGDTWRDIECAKSLSLFSYGVKGGAGFPYPDTSPHNKTKPNLFAESLFEAVQTHIKKI